jgi:Baseplate J-like protein
MAYSIPTTQQLYEAHLARLEASIGQQAPGLDKAFLVVLAISEAGLDIGLYKFAADAALQNLALTATGEGLDRIGLDNNTPRQQAQACIVTAELPSATGTVIPAGREFVGDANGLRYKTEADVTAAADIATIQLRCVDVGTAGNLDVADTLSISAQIAGAETVAEVTIVDQIGTDAESDADYRPRVLFAQRATTGGGNASDHKIWSEAVTGVKRAFPYSGRPADEGDSYPGDRTVYVECQTTIDADGIPPAPLLDDVRDAINTDPLTGLSRMILGLTDDTLWVEPIIRTSIFVEIRDLDVDVAKEAKCKSDISDALDLYFRTIAPFIEGVDVVTERNDSIMPLTVSRIVQDVLMVYGAVSQGIGFGLVVGVFLPLYYLDPGELVKLGGVAYA